MFGVILVHVKMTDREKQQGTIPGHKVVTTLKLFILYLLLHEQQDVRYLAATVQKLRGELLLNATFTVNGGEIHVVPSQAIPTY